jgi:hypothetical protein
MMKEKLNWKRPLFFALLPIFFIMIFLGFPLPLAPPPATMPGQEQSVLVKRPKRRIPFWRSRGAEDEEDDASEEAGGTSV